MLIPSQKTVDQPVLFLKVTLYTAQHTLKTLWSPFLSSHTESIGLCSSILSGVAMETENIVCARVRAVGCGVQPACVLISSLVLSGHVSH